MENCMYLRNRKTHGSELIKVNTLYEFFTKINGSKLFIGNQSGPMAWATAMNVNREIELLATIDNIHYIKDKDYYSQFNYFRIYTRKC